jgi:hypothetical protein
METEYIPVQHDGEFVLTRNGNKDFGGISPEIAKEIRRQPGKIRLRIGKEEGERGNFGEKHIERPDRLQQLQDNGYKNDTMIYVELTPSEGSDYYDVKTGLITRKDFMNKKKPLWKNQNG